jgi:hypothetical protein
LFLLIFLRGENAAHQGRDAEGGKNRGSHARGLDLSRLTSPGKLKARPPIAAKALK